jgi:hypothetical protein
MAFKTLPRWTFQALGGAALAVVLSFAAGAAAPSEPQAAPAQAAKPASCEPGYSGSPESGCVDVNECAVSNGGCHRLTACENTPGSRTCGGCPKDYVGDGYIGCFDVNECANPDCSDRMPAGADDTSAPVVTTSGDVSVAATSSAGGAPGLLHAGVRFRLQARAHDRHLLGLQQARQDWTRDAQCHGHAVTSVHCRFRDRRLKTELRNGDCRIDD